MKIQQIFLSDSRLATSIGNAVINDRPAMVLLAVEELRATADREVAYAIAGHTSHRDPPPPDLGVEASLFGRLEALSIGMDDDTASCFNESLVLYPGTEIGESSKWATGRKYQGSSVLRECISCGDLRRTIRVPYRHYYCQDCIMALYTAVLTDEILHPIRCCKQEIPMSVTRRFLTSKLAAKAVQKTIEYSILDRTYCSDLDCHQFVGPEHIEGLTAICRLCTQRTCTLCKSQQHAGKCPEDPGRDQLLRLATQERWQTCGRCNAVIELDMGCNHITYEPLDVLANMLC